MALCAWLWAMAAPAAAPRAREHFERGAALYQAKDYEGAVAAFEAAYALEPEPQTLFAWAQAERLSGDCESAVKLYQRFLDSGPSLAHARLAAENKALCEVALATRPKVVAPESTVEHPPPSESASPPRPQARPEQTPALVTERSVEAAQRSPGSTRWMGGALCAAGTASLAVGAVFLVRSHAALGRSQESYEAFVTAKESQSQRTLGWLLAGAGGLLAGGGLVWLVRGGGDAPVEVAVGSAGPERALHIWGKF